MRDYDPTTGRYIQADPLGLVDGPSVYGYALQNPGRYVDPRRENTLAIGAGIGSVGGPIGVGAGAIIGGIIGIGGYILYNVIVDDVTPDLDENCDDKTDCKKRRNIKSGRPALLTNTASKTTTLDALLLTGIFVPVKTGPSYFAKSTSAAFLDPPL